MLIKRPNIYQMAEAAAAPAGGGEHAAGAAPAGGAPAGGAPAADSTPKWPENWRAQFAANDPKALQQLERYASPEAVWQKARALEQRLSSGELRSVLPKDATPEQVTAWRKENGIPEAPDKYELKLKDGLVIGEQDKPIIEGFLKRVHGKNITNDQATGFVEAYYAVVEEENARIAQDRTAAEQKVTDALNVKWGQDYRGNMTRINSLIDAHVGPESKLKGMIQTTLKGNQEFAEFMDAIAREINPGVTLTGPGGEQIGAGGIESEIAVIEKRMREDRDGYNRDVKQQERYLALLAAREKAQGKGA